MEKIKKIYTIEPEGFKKMDVEVKINDNGYICIFKNLDFINHYNVGKFYVEIQNGSDKFVYDNSINKNINEINNGNSREILNDDTISKIWNCIKENLDNTYYEI